MFAVDIYVSCNVIMQSVCVKHFTPLFSIYVRVTSDVMNKQHKIQQNKLPARYGKVVGATFMKRIFKNKNSNVYRLKLENNA